MEMMMNVVDGIFSIAELIEEIKGFFQREDVQQALVKGQQIGRSVVLVVALVATVMFWFAVCGVKAIYRAWAVALPVAIEAFREGYAGIQADVQATRLVLPTSVEAAASMDVVEATAKPLSQQLRQQCQAAGIRWRNANGRSKHLTVKQMQAALAGTSSQDFANV